MQIILNIVFLWLLLGSLSFMLLIMTLKGESCNNGSNDSDAYDNSPIGYLYRRCASKAPQIFE